MGIEFSQDDTTNGSSNIVLKDKVYYDFNLKFDCLLLETGTVSINFRQKDNFNYYSFIIDKNSGNKILSKNINGNMIILYKIYDGAITINQWHTVIIKMRANKIMIKMYDAESNSQSKIESEIENIIETYDSTFIKGTIGYNIRGIRGFYIDNFSIYPSACWSPWYPKENLDITNANSSLYDEDFSGVFEEKYTIHNTPDEGDDGPIRDGPASWSYQDGGTFEPNFILQESKIWDSSNLKRTNYIIKNKKHFQHGTYIVKFTPLDDGGIISIIFKYINDKGFEKFYVFEMNNERKENSFDLKFFKGGEVQTLATINASTITDFREKAYVPNKQNFVHIDVINGKISIKVSQDNRDLISIVNILDLSIQGGKIGFGTYKTACKFTTVRMYPPKLKLTPNDIDKVLSTAPNRLFTTTPLPSSKKIDDVYQTLSKKFLPNGGSAYEDVRGQISSFSSSLGYNFGNSSGDGGASASPSNENSPAPAATLEKRLIPGEDQKKKEESNQWKQCIMARTENNRSTWCSNNFSSDMIRLKCKVNK
jgi:hypothetical protein